ncbi:MAG TPA: prephenate dehydrogenase/arogenate dehydrogenase family protein [Polyangiaceae bacterium]|jgi:prephenate dehydrogenase|nr:prephenate dehydrogenase/arogenate dehydrogenase family protein [Polyangiaceae bacterium]
MNRLAIFGFGLIGGSVALAARAAEPGVHITAIDRASVLGTPETARAADALVDVQNWAEAERALAESTLTVLAAPVSVICERVLWALEHAPLVTDCGSTKRCVLERARKSPRARRFVAGHPMAGLPEGGVRNASAELFQGRTWIVCAEGADTDAVSEVERWVELFGARVLRFTAELHDAAVARTSHLPQLLASALSLIGDARGARSAAGPAFERATRIAGGPESMWRDIFASNGDEIARALRELFAELEPVLVELEAGGGTQGADSLLARARQLRASQESK